jgi:hypothetical protein
MIFDPAAEGDSAICNDCVPHLREGRDVMFAEPEKLTARRTGTSYSWASCKARARDMAYESKLSVISGQDALGKRDNHVGDPPK